MMVSYVPTENDVLLVVDVQNDFCPGGALAIPDGDQIVPVVNRVARHFPHIVLTQDWHPKGHRSFASSYPGKKPFDVTTLPYGRQILWPDHCIQDTTGAELRADLDLPRAELIIRKGFRREVDSYSAFYENDRKTPTGLEGYLRQRGITRVAVVGLALDFCVRYSAEDAARAGFKVAVIMDGCWAIDTDGSLDATRDSFRSLDIRMIPSSDVQPAA
jgi:nicotinamidase/pyrazinamidase